MEQANNTFSEGLLMDVHPMVQGNNSLSNALNATFVTQNGNEIILQNDMGNRRVDNAYLPSGYEPVGIKEYGGVIYVASYNPITNRSQIGSFPSPEIKVNESEKDLFFDLKDDLNKEFTTTTSYGINFLLNDFVIKLLNKNKSLHIGDKFTVYGNSFSEYKDKISNYNNTINNKIKSPKNKKFTLSLGILNAQNEFIDITPSLERWTIDDNPEIIDESEKSDLYKFNDGYFIPNLKSNNSLTENDNNLLTERSKIAANTYTYKLVGPLALKIKLNHIEEINYNLKGIKNRNEKGEEITTLIFTANVKYNCEDGINDEYTSLGNDTYKSFLEGVPTFNVFDIYYRNNKTLYPINPPKKISSVDYITYDKSYDKISYLGVNFEKKSPTESFIEKCIYDPITNLYSTKITKIYEITQLTGKYDYYFCVDSGIELDDKKCYLKNLSIRSSIDLDLIGKNYLALNLWRTKFEDENTNLIVGFQEYKASFDDKFKYNITAEFKDELEGPKLIQFTYGESSVKLEGFEKRHIYMLTGMSYDRIKITKDENGNNIEKTDEENIKIDIPKDSLYVLTTPLLDNIDLLNKENDELSKKLEISIEINNDFVELNSKNLFYRGNLISKEQHIKYIQKNRIFLDINPKITIFNKYDLNITENDYPLLLIDEIKKKYENVDNYEISTNNNDVKYLNGYVEYDLIFETDNVTNPTVKNLFEDVRDVLYDIFNYTNQTKQWATIIPDYTSLSGTGDHHYAIGIASKKTSNFIRTESGHDSNEDIEYMKPKTYDEGKNTEIKYCRLNYDSVKHDAIKFPEVFSTREKDGWVKINRSDINKFIDDNVANNAMFTYGFRYSKSDEFGFYIINNNNELIKQGESSDKAILFIKVYDDENNYNWEPWYNHLLESPKRHWTKELFDELTTDLFTKDYVYCTQNNIKINNLYIPKIDNDQFIENGIKTLNVEFSVSITDNVLNNLKYKSIFGFNEKGFGKSFNDDTLNDKTIFVNEIRKEILLNDVVESLYYKDDYFTTKTGSNIKLDKNKTYYKASKLLFINNDSFFDIIPNEHIESNGKLINLFKFKRRSLLEKYMYYMGIRVEYDGSMYEDPATLLEYSSFY